MRAGHARPILDIHSLSDPVVPYQGHPDAAGYSFALPSVPAWLAGWASLDHLPGAAVTAPTPLATHCP